MFAENQKISVRQLEAMLLLDFFGTAVLFLPSQLTKQGGNSGWMIAAIWGLGAAFTALLLVTLGKKVPSYSAVEWYRAYFGKLLGGIFALGLGVKFLLDGAMELRIFTEIISRSMLPRTPLWLMMAVILLLCGLAAAQGTECRGRLAEILFFLVFLPLALVLIAVAVTAEYGKILPLTFPNGKNLWESAPYFGPVFQGLPILLMIFPFLEKPEKAGRRVFVTCLVATVALTALVFLSLAVYGKETLAGKEMPTLQMMERVSFTGIFLSRQDLLLLWFWMASAFLFVSAALFFGSVICVRVFGRGREKGSRWVWLWMVLVFIVAVIPMDMHTALAWRLRYAPLFNGIYLLFLPILLLLIHQWKHGERRRCKQ